MKSILLFLCFISCSYCLEMTLVSRNSRTSLPTTSSEDKYFYLKNSYYYSSSNYIYICLEDDNFGLNFNIIQYCRTTTDPSSYPYTAVSSCSFSTIYYYNSQSSSSKTKYFYKIIKSSSYTYFIIKYSGKHYDGNLYVTYDYNDDFVQNIKMTHVYRNSKTSLPTTSSVDKYFYLTNTDYYSYSKYIYICLEDNNFDLSIFKIQYCLTANNPNTPDTVNKNCYFMPIFSYRITQSSSTTYKYYFKMEITSSFYTYSIVKYEGKYSSGKLYVTSDYNDLVPTIKMTQISRNSRTSLPISSSNDKYFYLTNSDYYLYSTYIYLYLEDNNFGLSYNNIRYCRTNTNPSSNIDNVVYNCTFSTIYYYSRRSSSIKTKYYYRIPINSYFTYSIVYYEGSYSSGNLYVTTDYTDLVKNMKMTQVSRSSRASLPTTSSEDKYFYLTNRNYYSNSNYIYICLEDNNFGLSYNNIQYCLTNTNPNYNPDSALSNCSFSSIPYYNTKNSSGITKYYYRIPTTSSSYSYSIINYEGSYSSGNLYVTSDYENISSDDSKGSSSGAIIGIIVGSIAVLVIMIIIIYRCCCKKNKIDFIPVTQPYYPDPNSFQFPPNQTNMLLPIDNPNVQLQPINVINEAD